MKVLGWDEDSERVEYLRLPRTKHKKNICLLLHDGHFSVVKSLSKLVNSNLGKHKYYFCPYCPFSHKSEDSVVKHMENCSINELTEVEMPKKGEHVRFNNWEYTLRKPFAIYADYESRLEKKDTRKGNKKYNTNSDS